MKRAVIVVGGSIDLVFANQYLNHLSYDCLLAVDNGLLYVNQLGLKPNVLVGDFDTANAGLVNHYRTLDSIEIIELVPEKDETDTETAVDYTIRMGYDEVVLLGAMGGRFDHTLGNVHMLYRLLQHQIRGVLVDEKNRICMSDTSLKLTRKELTGTYVSLIPFSTCVEGVTLTGFKYPLKDYTLTAGVSLGISNEVVEESCEISFTKGILIIIEAHD